MKTKKLSFTGIKIGHSFIMGGTHWYKKSSRTACIYGQPDRWFYFSKNDIVSYNKPY